MRSRSRYYFAVLILAAQLVVNLTACTKFSGSALLESSSLSPGTSLDAQCAALPALAWGVGAHSIASPTIYSDIEAQMKILNARGIRSYRVDIALASDTDSYVVTSTRNLVTLAAKYCVKVNPMLALPFTWGDRTDNGAYPAGDSNALYQQGYNRTLAFVTAFRNDIQDWELENELNLLNVQSGVNGGHPSYGEGYTAAEFDNVTYNDWKYVLKGMSDAIDTVNTTYGLHLRRTLNTTTTHFGFIDFMKNFGVVVDVIDYHYYEVQGTNPHNYWGTFDLFTKLATFNIPIKIGEINCGEIYDSSYVNTPGTPLYEQCLTNLNTQLGYFKNQTTAQIEDITMYELLDEQSKTGAESRFGLMFDINTPKTALHLLTRFAGGALSAAETADLASHGL